MANHIRRAGLMRAACGSLVVAVLEAALAGAGERRGFVMEDGVGINVPRYQESHALLLSVSGYSNGWPPLRSVGGGLEEVRLSLGTKGFQVEVVEDPDRFALEDAYRDFIRRHGHTPDNRLLFYFSGHGFTEKRYYGAEDRKDWRGYVVSREAPLPDIDFYGFRRNAISMRSFEELAKQIQSKHTLFVFESCFSDSLFSVPQLVAENVSRKTGEPVRHLITACSADQELSEMSEFQSQFIAGLQGSGDLNGDGYVTVSELALFLKESVVRISGGTQTPQYGTMGDGLDRGEFVFTVHSQNPEAIPDMGTYEDSYRRVK